MSDVSRLLDDLYGTDPEADPAPVDGSGDDAAASPAVTRAPDWSSEEALDEVFSSWVPGQPGSSSRKDLDPIADEVDAPAEIPVVEDWVRASEPIAQTTGEPIPGPAVTTRWSPADDDILPARRRRRR